jgi:disulfide bond formation protein DsbB
MPFLKKRLTGTNYFVINIIQMFKEKKRVSFLFYVAFFCVIVLFAQFFHQEKSIQQKEMEECPICIWQKNTVALASLYFLVIFIIFNIVGYLYLFNDRLQFYLSFYHYFQRGPPGNQ